MSTTANRALLATTAILTLAAGLVSYVAAEASAAPLTCGGERATIRGTERADTITGTAGDDVIVARGGNDHVDGVGGSDLICAGPGRDVVLSGGGFADAVHGDAGDDRIVGESFESQLFGDAGADRLEVGVDGARAHGGPGDDTVLGTAFADHVTGDGGDDTLTLLGGDDVDVEGGSGDDTIDGGSGSDLLDGGDDDDVVTVGAGGSQWAWGGDGTDALTGGRGADVLEGGAGDDVLTGLAGNDQMFGRTGVDTCTGGAGEDYCDGGPKGTDAPSPDDPDTCSVDTEDRHNCRWGTPTEWVGSAHGTLRGDGTYTEHWTAEYVLEQQVEDYWWTTEDVSYQWSVDGTVAGCTFSGSAELDAHGELMRDREHDEYSLTLRGPADRVPVTRSCPGEPSETVLIWPLGPSNQTGTLPLGDDSDHLVGHRRYTSPSTDAVVDWSWDLGISAG